MSNPILALLAILISSAICAWEWRTYALGQASRRWTRTDGLIVDARIDESIYPDDDDVVYSAHLIYAYTVRGRRYRSRRFTYRPTRYLGQTAAYGLLQGIRRGQTVDVYYDPDRPERAVVFPGIDSANRFRLGFWGAALVVAIVWLATFIVQLAR
jgi:hypothetical protein